jgi:hypothetical protein
MEVLMFFVLSNICSVPDKKVRKDIEKGYTRSLRKKFRQQIAYKWISL